MSGSSLRIDASLRVDTKPPKEGEGVRVSWRQAMASGPAGGGGRGALWKQSGEGGSAGAAPRTDPGSREPCWK